MSVLAWTVLAVAIVGALFYLWSPKEKLAELGRITFFAGLLVWLALHLGRSL